MAQQTGSAPGTTPIDRPAEAMDLTGRRRWTPFVLVEAATALSGVANGISMVAIPWLVLELTGSATAAGLLAGITALPLVIAALFSGSVVDLIGKRRTSILSDTLSMASVAAIPILAAFDALSFGVLIALAIAGAVFDPAGITAREAMLPGAAKAARLPLERANGIHEATWGVAFLVGPGVGGLLLGLVGSTATFWGAAVCFVLSIVAIALVRMPSAEAPDAEDRERFWPATKAGIVFVARDRLLRAVAILYALLVAVYMPVQGIVLPAYFEEQDRPEALGSILMMMSVGGVVGALAYGAWGVRARRFPILVISCTLSCVPVIAMAWLPALPLFLVLAFVSGLFFGPMNPIVNLAMQERTPDALLGRVIGLLTSAAYALAPIGYLVGGWSYGLIGAGPTLLAIGITLTVISLACVFSRGLRLLDHPAPRTAEPVDASPVDA
jgi:MFS family permease